MQNRKSVLKHEKEVSRLLLLHKFQSEIASACIFSCFLPQTLVDNVMTEKITKPAGYKAHLVRENKLKCITLSALKNKSAQQATQILKTYIGSSLLPKCSPSSTF